MGVEPQDRRTVVLYGPIVPKSASMVLIHRSAILAKFGSRLSIQPVPLPARVGDNVWQSWYETRPSPQLDSS